VVAIGITKSELHGCRVRIPVRLLLEPGYQSAHPRQRLVEIINPKEQEQAVARPWFWSVSGGCPRAPTGKGRADRTVRVDCMTTEVAVGRPGTRLHC
jgi:hypothetical protein